MVLFYELASRQMLKPYNHGALFYDSLLVKRLFYL